MKGKVVSTIMACFLIASVFMTLGVSASEPQVTNNYTPRSLTLILSDSDFTVGNGISSGTGTESDPYIFEDWSIDGSVLEYALIFDTTTAHCIVRNCEFYGARGQVDSCGIYLYDAPNITIENCTIYDNEIGIVVDTSYNVLIDDCLIYENGEEETGGIDFTGISVYLSNNITISNNEITEENTDSIRLYRSEYCIIDNNFIYNGTEDAIDLIESSYCVVSNNIIYNCLNGVWGNGGITYPCEYNLIYNNTISNNQEKGFYFYNTENNTFYYNNLINNNGNVMEFNELSFNGQYYSNVWYSQNNKGNYWDDYTGTDTTGDGIGEEPKPIVNITSETVNFDYYPLVNVYNGSLPTPSGNVTNETAGSQISTILIQALPLLVIVIFIKLILGQLGESFTNNKKEKKGA